ncbi:MAG: JAB domain-containing protein [Lacunisphaera sp.]
MQIYQALLQYTLVQLGGTDPLTKPNTFVNYMIGAFADVSHEESLWLISMNPKCRPIARTLLRTGPLVAAMTSPRDLFRAALQADAHTIAVVRGEPTGEPLLTVHDQQALKRFNETAGYLNIRFIDYLVISTRDDHQGPQFHSWKNATKWAN